MLSIGVFEGFHERDDMKVVACAKHSNCTAYSLNIHMVSFGSEAFALQNYLDRHLFVTGQHLSSNETLGEASCAEHVHII